MNEILAPVLVFASVFVLSVVGTVLASVATFATGRARAVTAVLGALDLVFAGALLTLSAFEGQVFRECWWPARSRRARRCSRARAREGPRVSAESRND